MANSNRVAYFARSPVADLGIWILKSLRLFMASLHSQHRVLKRKLLKDFAYTQPPDWNLQSDFSTHLVYWLRKTCGFPLAPRLQVGLWSISECSELLNWRLQKRFRQPVRPYRGRWHLRQLTKLLFRRAAKIEETIQTDRRQQFEITDIVIQSLSFFSRPPAAAAAHESCLV